MPNTTTHKRPPWWLNEDVINWVVKRTEAKRTRQEMIDESMEGEHGWPLDDRPLTENAYISVRAVLASREHPSDEEPQQPKKPKWSGKRLRELHTEKRTGRADSAMALQLNVAKSVALLEEFELPEIDWDEGMNAELFGFIFDDITELGNWIQTATLVVASHMDEMAIQRKLSKLRIVANDESSSEGERANARRILDTLARKKTQINAG